MSLFKVKKHEIINACNNCINKIKYDRGQEFRVYVKYHMGVYGLGTSFSREKMKMTFAESAKYLNKNGVVCGQFSGDKPWTNRYHEEFDYAKNLLNACKVDIDWYIMLDKEDTNFVYKWRNK